MACACPWAGSGPGRLAAKTVSVLAGDQKDPLSRDRFQHFFWLFYDDTDLDEKEITGSLTPQGK